MLPVESAELVVRQAKQLGGVALMMASLGQGFAKRALLEFADGVGERSIAELETICLAS